jgi:diaminohydroxyphosphoribosylaminopyrimidine deaminase/5-amino-6-(5-phosphoribosylamino)uracil reductase
MAECSPGRVVLDPTLRLGHDARVVASALETPLWVITGEAAAPERAQALQSRGVEIFRVPAADGKLDLSAALKALAGRGITRLMVETGPILAAPAGARRSGR